MKSLIFYGVVLLGSFSLLPAAQAQHQPGTGLRGQYYEGQNLEKLVLTRTDPAIDFNWTTGPGGDHFVAPGPGVPGEWFSVRWTGHLYAPATGIYTLHVTTDDGVRVWIGGRKVLEAWRDQPATTATVHVKMKAGGYYALRVEYYQAGRDSRALLAWQLPGSTSEPKPIPTANLYQTLLANVLMPVEPKTSAPRFSTPRPAPAVAVTPAPQPQRATPAPPQRRVRSAARVAAAPKPVVPPAPPAPLDTPVVTLPDLAGLGKGAAVTLPNLYFTQSTAALLPTSRPTLNALARTLREQPALHLEIAGHTDNVGEASLNLRLSEQRAQVVRRYLVQQGIDSVRLTARGYGGTRPVANNRDPQQRPRNRRVEVVVQ